MTRTVWRTIIASRHFYVNTFRRLRFALLFSIALNVLLCVLIGFVYLSRPQPDFYASNGMTAPVPLKPYNAPNASSQALLESAPPAQNIVKQIPE